MNYCPIIAVDRDREKPGFFEKHQETSCKEPAWAYQFAWRVNDSNISYCQNNACKNEEWAYYFSKDIPEADIEYCYEFSREYKESIAEWIVRDL